MNILSKHTHIQSLLILFCCCFSIAVTAQPFVADKYGYVKDTAFHKLIKEREYKIVGAFDTMNGIYSAEVYYMGEWRYIDIYGNLIAEKERNEEKDYLIDRIREVNIGDEGFDVVAVPPDEKGTSRRDNDEYEVVFVNGKSGTKHKKTGKKGLEPIYDIFTLYGDGLIGLKKDGKHGMAYSNGKVFIEPVYDEVIRIYSYGVYQNSAFRIKKEGKFGLVDSLGKVLFKTEYQMITNAYDCNTGKQQPLLVRKDDKWKLVSITNAQLAPGEYADIKPLITGLIKYTYSNNKVGLLTCKGEVLLDSQDKITYDYYEGLITFEKNRLIGKMKSDGSIKVKQRFESIYDLGDGYTRVMQNGKYGLINKNEEFIVQPMYDGVDVIKSWGLIAVEERKREPVPHSKHGLLDMNGKVVINVLYDALDKVSDSILFFANDNKFGLMGWDEKVIKYFEYDRVYRVGHFYKVSKNYREGIVDVNGNVLLPVKYDYVKDGYDFYSRGYCKVKLKGQYYLVDRYGNEEPRNW